MAEPIRVYAEVDEGADGHNVGIATFSNRTALVQGDVSSIALDVFEVQTSAALYSAVVVVSAVIFNTLQLDGYWGLDSDGYNFRHKIRQADLGTVNLEGGKTYMFVYRLTTSAEGVIPLIFFWTVRPIRPT